MIIFESNYPEKLLKSSKIARNSDKGTIKSNQTITQDINLKQRLLVYDVDPSGELISRDLKKLK